MRSWERMGSEERIGSLAAGVVSSDYPGPVASDWPDLLCIVETLVKSFREKQKRQAVLDRWWQYERNRPGLRRAIKHLDFVLVLTRSPYPAKAGCPTVAGRRRTRAAPAGMAPALSWS